jgi:hypothetical protein
MQIFVLKVHYLGCGMVLQTKPQIEEGQTTQWLKGQTMMYFTEN